MSTKDYIGDIYAILFDVLNKEDGFSVGEKLTAVKKLTKKDLFYCSNKEIYEAMENYVNTPIEVDEPFDTDENFIGFVDVMLEGKEKQKIFGVGIYYENEQ